ncbi:MAG: M48 family metallopeptidase [Bacteroidales bacterium]|jgi:predicted metal-dependent hydrolase|nr:M48 family metallopeptidase [Bacteroidales bacterium]
MRQSGSTKVVHFQDIGEVTFVKSVVSRSFRISLKPFGGIRVTLPQWESYQRAMEFVKLKKEWIIRARSKIAQQENTYTVFTPETDFSTASKTVKLFPCNTTRFRVYVTRQQLQIFYPQDIDLLSDMAQSAIRRIITDRLRKEAREYLPERTRQIAELHGFSYRGVTVKLLSSRWGSCSSCDHINLNLHLMRLPRHLQDYVILHELVHTVHKNHRQGFWDCLNRHTNGNAKPLAAEMRRYNAAWF